MCYFDGNARDPRHASSFRRYGIEERGWSSAANAHVDQHAASSHLGAKKVVEVEKLRRLQNNRTMLLAKPGVGGWGGTP